MNVPENSLLGRAVHWRSPTAHDWKNNQKSTQVYLSDQTEQGNEPSKTGQLSPDWVEWLMGWPISWTSLEPITDLIWLDWSVDPADVESDEKWPSPRSSAITDGDANFDKRKAEGKVSTPKLGTAVQREQAQRWPTPNMMDGLRTGKETDLEHWRKSKARHAKKGVNKYRPVLIACLEAEEIQPSQGIIPRVATGIKDRVARLKAIGNGQVPIVAATAWEILKP